MAITTVAGIASGLLPQIISYKTSPSGTSNSGPFQWCTNWYETGYPVAATAYTGGAAGAAITTSTAAYPYPNPATGNSYLARVTRSGNAGNPANVMIVDRLWENSGLDRTLTTAQTINSATWPSRDINGNTTGVGVYIALEVSTTVGGGATTPTITMSYTNTDSTPLSGRISSNFFGTRVNPPRGQWFILGLAAGDVGVQSVQSITFSASWGTSGVLNLVAFRVLALLDNSADVQRSSIEDAINIAMPRMYDNTILQSVSAAFSSTEDQRTALEVTQG